MIDHAAAAAAWDRYRRGETNAFSSRIYNWPRCPDIDEIRRRYRADLEFRATVDRYGQEFERLLAELGRMRLARPPPRHIFLSETGKVTPCSPIAAGQLS